MGLQSVSQCRTHSALSDILLKRGAVFAEDTRLFPYDYGEINDEGTLHFSCRGEIKTEVSRLFSHRETINAEVTRHFPYGGAITADSLFCARDSGTSLI